MHGELSPGFASDGMEPAGWWRRWRMALLVCAVVLTVVFAGLRFPSVWRWGAIYPLGAGWADAEAILAAGEAWLAGADPYEKPSRFDSLGRPHIYGPAWLLTGAVGWTVAHTAEWGLFTFVVFMAGLAAWYRPASWRDVAVACALLLSPPVLLGLERANNDLLLVGLMTFAAWVSVGCRSMASVGAVALLAAAAWLKIYPVFAGMALFTMAGTGRVLWVRVAGWGLLVFAGFALYADDYRRVIEQVPRYETIYSLHFPYAVRMCLDGPGVLRMWIWGGAAASLLVAIVILRGRMVGLWRLIPERGYRAFMAVAASAMWTGSLLAGPSYLYRAVWLVGLAGCLAREGGRRSAGTGFVWLIGWFFAGWWLLWQTEYRWGNTSAGPGFAWFGVAVGVTQMAVCIVTLTVAWMLAGWCARRLKARGVAGGLSGGEAGAES